MITNAPSPLTLDNLADLNALGGPNVSLSSTDDFTKFPAWLNGVKPDSTGKAAGDPSMVLAVNDLGNGTVTAFYLYFYPFNEGNVVLGTDAGNHVGDWEHNAIRFENGVPQSLWFSQHANGEAFTYAAVEKQGKRPVAYSAKGTHAVYGTAGASPHTLFITPGLADIQLSQQDHDHTIPNLNLPFPLFLTDKTSQGTLWDPLLATYTYSPEPTSYLLFQGIWGDETLPASDPRQHSDLGIVLTDEWTGGPTGPDDKDLGRANICPGTGSCDVKTVLVAK